MKIILLFGAKLSRSMINTLGRYILRPLKFILNITDHQAQQESQISSRLLEGVSRKL